VVPSIARRRRKRLIIQGETPNPANIPPGCRFHPRCPLADAGCRETDPALELKAGRLVACIKV
jgi:peptide/nickel transport system ATP-binding protein